MRALHEINPIVSPPNGQNAEPHMQEKLHQSLWMRVKRILPHREDLVVAGREVKGGIVIHPIIATAILGAIIAIGLSIRAEMNWQHDQLVIITTQKVEAEKAKAKADEDLAKRLQNMDAVGIVNGREIAKLQEAKKLEEAQKGRN